MTEHQTPTDKDFMQAHIDALEAELEATVRTIKDAYVVFLGGKSPLRAQVILRKGLAATQKEIE